MRLSAEYLQVFAVTLEENSVSKAATRLNLSQPTVSGHLKRLTEIVGEPLYRRSSQGLIPTYAGLTLLPHAQAVSRTLGSTVAHIEEYRHLERGIVHFGASSTPAAFHVPQMMAEFYSRHHKLQCKYTTGGMQKVLTALRHREVEWALLAGKPKVPPDLRSVAVASEELLLVLSPWHPWSFKDFVDVKDLAGVPLILREKDSETRRQIEAILANAGIKAEVGLELSSHEAVKEAISLGLGIGFLPKAAVKRDSYYGFVAALRVKGADFRRNYYVVRPAEELLTRAARAFLQVLFDYFDSDRDSIIS